MCLCLNSTHVDEEQAHPNLSEHIGVASSSHQPIRRNRMQVSQVSRLFSMSAYYFNAWAIDVRIRSIRGEILTHTDRVPSPDFRYWKNWMVFFFILHQICGAGLDRSFSPTREFSRLDILSPASVGFHCELNCSTRITYTYRSSVLWVDANVSIGKMHRFLHV